MSKPKEDPFSLPSDQQAELIAAVKQILTEEREPKNKATILRRSDIAPRKYQPHEQSMIVEAAGDLRFTLETQKIKAKKAIELAQEKLGHLVETKKGHRAFLGILLVLVVLTLASQIDSSTPDFYPSIQSTPHPGLIYPTRDEDFTSILKGTPMPMATWEIVPTPPSP